MFNFCRLLKGFGTILLLMLLFSEVLKAQLTERNLKADFGLYSTISSEKYQSFWLVNNQWGTYDESSANGVILFSLQTPVDQEQLFDWGGGLTMLSRSSKFSTIHLQEGWLEAKAGIFNLKTGRFRHTIGHTYEALSSGSAVISRNATPVPKVMLSIPDFVEIPYTFGLLEFKGHFSHGWLNEQRSVSNAYLHDKSFYLQTGSDWGFKFYTGMVHFAQWGGTSEIHGDLPNSFSDFLNVIKAGSGDSDAPVGEQENALGAHNGFWDWGLRVDINQAELHVYYQHIFSDESGLLYRNLRDGLYGIGIENPFRTKLITGFLWEFLYTKHQTGPGLWEPREDGSDQPPFCEEINCGYRFNGRDDYYNNFVYRSGWTYHSSVLGNPLFMTYNQAAKIDPDMEHFDDRFIVSNRIVAHHIGIKGEFSDHLGYRSFATYSRQYGTYHGLNLGEPWGSLDPDNNPEIYYFNPPRHQWYLMLETSYRFPNVENLSLHTTLAIDRGDMFNNTGVMAGVTWSMSSGR